MAQVFDGRYCFAHLPKTGGTWVRKAMQYMDMELTHDLEGGNHHPAPEGPWVTFTFIRHPARWLASWWAHEQRHGWFTDNPVPDSWTGETPYERMVEATAGYKSDNFSEFACGLESDQPGFVASFYREFIENCDFVGRQETLSRDLGQILCRPVVDFPPYNTTPEEYRAIITPGTFNYIEMNEPVEWMGYA